MAESGAGRANGDASHFRLLLDTNIFIAAEPYSGALESQIDTVNTMLRLAAEQRHQIFLHPATRDELSEGKDPDRVVQRLAEFNRYALIEESPISASLVRSAGDSVPNSNDHRDLRILASLHARAVTHLVTNDKGFLRRGYRAGLSDGIYSAQEALEQLRDLTPAEAAPPPLVERIPAYALDVDQSIFDGLREDYADFDKWLDKVRAEFEFRPCFVVKKDFTYAALALLKHEMDCDYQLVDPVLKVCTFKVGSGNLGYKYGELLLKAIFVYAHQKRCSSLYVEVFDKHESLLLLLSDFGFVELPGSRTERGELVMVKRMLPEREGTLSSLEYHKTYGPPALLINQAVWAIPIVPQWHQQLFPDAPDVSGAQLALPGIIAAADPKPWGNALKKAYLCLSKVKRMAPGDIVLFYRSQDAKAFTVVGVVEEVRRMSDPMKLLSYVGRRTVYSPQDIDRMCRKGEVMAILFRQDRFLDPPWELSELIGNGLLKSWPQSVVKIKKEGIPWLQGQIED